MWTDRQEDGGVYRRLNRERSTLFEGEFGEEIPDEVGVVEEVGMLLFEEGIDDVGDVLAGLVVEYFFELFLLEDEILPQT